MRGPSAGWRRQGAAAPDTGAASRQGKPILVDVLDHALSSEEWSGAFGFVTYRLHRGAVDGKDVWFIRTDSSDKVYADQEPLVWAPSSRRCWTAASPVMRT
jgi:hypothetical protein